MATDGRGCGRLPHLFLFQLHTLETPIKIAAGALEVGQQQFFVAGGASLLLLLLLLLLLPHHVWGASNHGLL